MSVTKHLMSLCQDRCSEFGEPSCMQVVEDNPDLRPWRPCRDCLEEAGLPADPEPIDPDAVVRPLL